MAELEEVVAGVLAARKYAAICPDTIYRLAAREQMAAPRAGVRTLVKATKRKLHQVYGAFEDAPDYELAYRRLAAAYHSADEVEVKAACRAVLELHSSTRERLPLLETFYRRIFEITGRPASVLDLGCGLNPLSLAWMALPPGARYEAFDIDARGIELLRRFFALAGPGAVARWQDVLAHPPRQAADVALLLKASATLERQEKGATARLVAALNAPFVVVSYAVASLGGRDRGMPAHYRRQFHDLAAGRPWRARALEFETELVFVVEKGRL